MIKADVSWLVDFLVSMIKEGHVTPAQVRDILGLPHPEFEYQTHGCGD